MIHQKHMDSSPANIDITYTPDGRCILRATWPDQLFEERPRFTYLGPLSCLPALMHALFNEVNRHFGRPSHRHSYCAVRTMYPPEVASPTENW